VVRDLRTAFKCNSAMRLNILDDDFINGLSVAGGKKNAMGARDGKEKNGNPGELHKTASAANYFQNSPQPTLSDNTQRKAPKREPFIFRTELAAFG